MKNITMRDIAAVVGVSVVTVSKALSGESGVGPEMRERIIRTAGEMGYINPKLRRRQLIKPLDIGVLVPLRYFQADSYYSMLYVMLAKELSNEGHFCLFETLSEEAELACEMPNMLRSDHINGLILLGEPRKEYLRAIAAQNLPVVYLDFFDEKAGAPAVVSDNSYGTYRLTSHLIKNGHRDIAFVGDRSLTSSIMDRFLGYYRAMLSGGLPLRQEYILSDRDAHGKVLLPELPEKMPTAFVCNCDFTAHLLMEKLVAMGYRIPEDISVVGFDDFPATPQGLPQLSTYRTQYETMVQTAVRLMIDRCAGENALPSRMVIGGYPCYKESDGPAPAGE